ncbi:YczE/YyaS/YitT family protein [Priestia taiwanensis]|uniref:YitT family protein n=1 Tax=Priestia taiwanensis TaxID=1347902 RepID=A0A917ER83_9BACI|nr:membrane protein [Priestia taiwanensis]MBM7364677.1 putative membrane protein YczE [Priestia taiwanensis]GGE78803.1 hypothetical protein GCM10007140_30420 [Priestia taiwanensis]
MKKANVLFYIIGLVFISLGACIVMKANMGAGPWDALTVGEYHAFGLSVGIWVIINGMIIMFINALLLRSRPEYVSLLTIMVTGMLMDFWLMRGLTFWSIDSLMERGVGFGIGIVMLAIGIAMYLPSQFPVNPLDKLMVALRARFGVSLGIAKIIIEVVAIVCAILLKGPIGVGTIIIACLLGPCVQFLYPRMVAFMAKVDLLFAR